jgi:membrane protease YdiL (CAAX protease family)
METLTPSRVVRHAQAASAIPEQHTLGQTVLLHLAPGLLVGAAFFLSAPLAHQWRLPPFMALCFAVGAVLVPGMLGFLLYQGYKKHGRLSLDGVVYYRDEVPWWLLVGLMPVIFLLSGGLIVLLAPVGRAIFTAYFAWLPDIFLLTPDLHAYPRQTLIVSYLVFFMLITVAAPVVEELYFRGYLLPRLERFGIWAVLINSVLFALYHIWTPWLAVGRAAGLLPLILIVQRKRNIYLGMGAHILANSVDVLVGVAFILQLSASR